MNIAAHGLLALTLSVTLSMTNTQQSEALSLAPAPAHTLHSFQFTVRAPFQRAARLFGPEGERCWAGPHWDPKFVYPSPGKDVQGAVFTVQHGPHNSVWVNTLFDLEHGRMQYVSVSNEKLVSIIDVWVQARNESTTQVSVTYARTALDAAVNDELEAMGKSDGESGPHWQKAIEACLAAER